VRVEYLPFVSRLRDVAREYWFELLIGALAVSAMCELVIATGLESSLWFDMPAIALAIAPLFARRRFPFAAPAAYWLLATAISFVDGALIPSMVSLFPVGLAAAFLLGSSRDRLTWAGLAIVLVGITTIVFNIPGHANAELLFIPVDFAIAWAAGFALRQREQQAQAAELRAELAERERDAAARVAVAEERARIARELHDIVAHAVSVMVLQVGAVRHRLPDSMAEDSNALSGVERAGRTALTEMRRLLAAMRSEGDEVELLPAPGLDGLDSLVGEIERAGLPVELHVDGDPVPLPRGIDLSAYRIVQEGLTNALKHSQARTVNVTVRYLLDELQIEVRDDGVGRATTDGHGHGLVGIRERVKIYGGEMSIGSRNGGGFVMTTRLPYRDEAQ
jgi:signal transduction histidine kinase